MNKDFDIIFKQKTAEVESILEKMFPSDYKETQLPDVLEESIRYSLFSGGKRIRPVLLLASYELCGGEDDYVYPLIAAIEMIHTYSLIHDDLPCMDNDDLRRGKPTNHIVFGYPTAVLAGDGLLNLAYETMFRGALGAPENRRENYLKAAYTIATAAGINGMIGGQCADITWEGNPPNEKELRIIHKNKTGALLKASVVAGALCAGATGDKLDRLCMFGEYIGDMFQIVDDILDVIGDEQEIGKKVNKDEQLHKMTYPYVFGIERSKEMISELEKKSMGCLTGFEYDIFLPELVKYLANRTK